MKFTSKAGSFTCRYCGTVYTYSDLRDACEGQEYWRREDNQAKPIYDELGAEVGEVIIRTQYEGEDYLPPNSDRRGGIRLFWHYEKVTEKRIVPVDLYPQMRTHHLKQEGYKHVAEYRISEPYLEKHRAIIGDHRWYDGAVAEPLGPYHIWSKNAVLNANWLRESGAWVEEDWMATVKNMCYGPLDADTLQRFYDEGFAVSKDQIQRFRDDPWTTVL